jgi:hypothetical protein
MAHRPKSIADNIEIFVKFVAGTAGFRIPFGQVAVSNGFDEIINIMENLKDGLKRILD